MPVSDPYRIDHVGSFIRPDYLKKARIQRLRGFITDEHLAEIED